MQGEKNLVWGQKYQIYGKKESLCNPVGTNKGVHCRQNNKGAWRQLAKCLVHSPMQPVLQKKKKSDSNQGVWGKREKKETTTSR